MAFPKIEGSGTELEENFPGSGELLIGPFSPENRPSSGATLNDAKIN